MTGLSKAWVLSLWLCLLLPALARPFEVGLASGQVATRNGQPNKVRTTREGTMRYYKREGYRVEALFRESRLSMVSYLSKAETPLPDKLWDELFEFYGGESHLELLERREGETYWFNRRDGLVLRAQHTQRSPVTKISVYQLRYYRRLVRRKVATPVRGL